MVREIAGNRGHHREQGVVGGPVVGCESRHRLVRRSTAFELERARPQHEVEPRGSAARVRPVDEHDIASGSDQQVVGADVVVDEPIAVERGERLALERDQRVGTRCPGVRERAASDEFLPAVEDRREKVRGCKQI